MIFSEHMEYDRGLYTLYTYKKLGAGNSDGLFLRILTFNIILLLFINFMYFSILRI